MSQLRVFYAIWPDAPSAQALDALAQRVATDAKGRATPVERLHLTLAFVGSVPVADLPRLIEIGREVASRAEPFELTLDRVGAFRDAGIAWIGTTDAPTPLEELAIDLKGMLATSGFHTEDRKFKAHITLARRCAYRPRNTDVVRIAWRVDALTLMQSQLTPHGLSYSVLERSPLSAVGPA